MAPFMPLYIGAHPGQGGPFSTWCVTYARMYRGTSDECRTCATPRLDLRVCNAAQLSEGALISLSPRMLGLAQSFA